MDEVRSSSLLGSTSVKKLYTKKLDEILSKIPQSRFDNSPEPTVVFRLGEISGATHDLVELFAGVVYPPHYHEEAEGPIKFIVGSGTMTLGDKEISYETGTEVFIPKKTPHGFIPKENSLFLSIQKPPVKRTDGAEDLHYDK